MREKSIKCVCLGLGLNLCGLAACSSQEETLPDNQPFLITSSIQGYPCLALRISMPAEKASLPTAT